MRVLRLQCKKKHSRRQTENMVRFSQGGAKPRKPKTRKITTRRREENDEHVGAFRARAAWASPTCIRGFLKRVVWLIPVVRRWKKTRGGTYRNGRTKQSYGTRASADQVDGLEGEHIEQIAITHAFSAQTYQSHQVGDQSFCG